MTRYQTVKLDPVALEMAQAILHEAVVNEQTLVQRFAGWVDEHEVRLFVSRMLQANALDPQEVTL